MKPPATPPPELPLAHFHRGLAARDDPDTMRDLGIAIVEVGFESGPLGPAFGRMALPYLQEAVRTWPEDVPAGEALAAALYLAGRLSDSLDTCNRVLALAADHERTLEYAGQNAFVLRRFGEAADYLQRAITLNPWSTRYRYQLAKVYEEKEDWPHVVRVCQEALRRNAHHRDCRMLLIYGLARCGRKDEARAEFQTLLGQHPPDPDKLRRWIDDLVR
jgi:Flp pilus assembly protein TadD